MSVATRYWVWCFISAVCDHVSYSDKLAAGFRKKMPFIIDFTNQIDGRIIIAPKGFSDVAIIKKQCVEINEIKFFKNSNHFHKEMTTELRSIPNPWSRKTTNTPTSKYEQMNSINYYKHIR